MQKHPWSYPPFLQAGLVQESNTNTVPAALFPRQFAIRTKCQLIHFCTCSVTELKLLLFEFYCMFPFLNHLFVQMYIPELTIPITHCISPFYRFPENLYSHSFVFHMGGLLLP